MSLSQTIQTAQTKKQKNKETKAQRNMGTKKPLFAFVGVFTNKSTVAKGSR